MQDLALTSPLQDVVPAELARVVANSRLRTPAFIFLQERILQNCRNLRRIADGVQVQALYSMKALTLPCLLPAMARILDGFSVSSLYEARLARDCAGEEAAVHLSTPALREEELSPVGRVCSAVSLNSISQLERHGAELGRSATVGLRINPGLSFAADPRYDPCAPQSHLGVEIARLESLIEEAHGALGAIQGLHVHSNCESEEFDELYATASRLVSATRLLGGRIRWVNLGGGYYFPHDRVPQGLKAAVGVLRAVDPRMEIVLEPGTDIAQDTGLLVTTVLDLIPRSPVPIAILDTTINHLPEVFDYTYRPDLLGADDSFGNRYTLSGRGCLAGDTFGDYGFAQPLEPGLRLCFANVGSYSLVKANTFNGIPTPHVYVLRPDGTLSLIAEPSYETWISQYGGARDDCGAGVGDR